MQKKLKPLIIGDLEIKTPIIQGGMGVKISRAPLAAAVANCGAAGTIASIGLAPDEEEYRLDYIKYSRIFLQKEIRQAREMSDGVIGVNIMGALNNYEDFVRATAQEKMDYIVSSAGMPLSLPEYTEGSPIKLIPMLSSARGVGIILKAWKRRYNRFPDAVIMEGPLSGGHIGGHTLEDLRAGRLQDLENMVKDSLKIIREYEDQYGANIPLIAAGGIFDGKDIARFLKMGAQGVQMGIRFIVTNECTVAEEYKQAHINATEKDLIYLQSPVGLPARVIRNKFVEGILRGEKKPVSCPYLCLRTCNPKETPFCMARALVDASMGKIDDAIVFAGINTPRLKKIVPVKELIDELTAEAAQELSREYNKIS